MSQEQDDMQRGFNAGYLLREKAPVLAEQFLSSLKNNEDEYARGLLAGAAEKKAEIEKSRARFKVPERNRKFTVRPINTRGKDDRDKSMDRDER